MPHFLACQAAKTMNVQGENHWLFRKEKKNDHLVCAIYTIFFYDHTSGFTWIMEISEGLEVGGS